MKSTSHLYSLLILCGVMLTLGYLSRSVYHVVVVRIHASSRVPAFTIRLSERYLDVGNSRESLTDNRIFAQRGDGSVAIHSVYHPGDQPNFRRRHLTFGDGKVTTINVDANAKSTERLSAPEQHRYNLGRRDPAQDCVKTYAGDPAVFTQYSVLRRETILGFTAIVVEDGLGGKGARKLTQWLAPDLACAELKRVMLFLGASGQVEGRSELVAVSVEPGPPAAELFTEPGVEMKPSDLIIADAQLRGVPLQSLEDALTVTRRTHDVRYGAHGH